MIADVVKNFIQLSTLPLFAALASTASLSSFLLSSILSNLPDSGTVNASQQLQFIQQLKLNNFETRNTSTAFLYSDFIIDFMF